jgi:hypothetical protein
MYGNKDGGSKDWTAIAALIPDRSKPNAVKDDRGTKKRRSLMHT